MVWTLAQESGGGIVEVLSGSGGGWAGAGLLGLVLGWLLLVYLPTKDKQLKELLELHQLRETQREGAYSATVLRLQAEYALLANQARVDNKDNLAIVVAHSEKEHALLVSQLKETLDKFMERG